MPDQILLFVKYFNYYKIIYHKFSYVFLFWQKNLHLYFFSIEHYLNIIWTYLRWKSAASNIASMSPIYTCEAPKIIKEFSTPLNIFQNVKESNPSTYNHLLDTTGSYHLAHHRDFNGNQNGSFALLCSWS